MRYNCQHQIHPSCGQDVKDCSICSIKTESLFEKHINSKDGIKTEMYAHPVAVSKAELRHKSLAQKLADYDQMVRAE